MAKGYQNKPYGPSKYECIILIMQQQTCSFRQYFDPFDFTLGFYTFDSLGATPSTERLAASKINSQIM